MAFVSHCASWGPVGREGWWLTWHCVAVVALPAQGNIALADELRFSRRLFC